MPACQFRVYNLNVKAPKYSQLFFNLTHAIKTFLEEVNKHNPAEIAAGKWTVKDVLCHIAFWHNYYADNYSALAAKTKPFVFPSKGGSTRNQEGVESLTLKSQKELETIVNQAQKSLYKSIVVREVSKMHYTGQNEYKTEDFLEMITGHIQRHTVHIRKAKQKLN